MEYTKYIGGRSNHIPLTSRGQEQARALGKRLAHYRFDEIYSSPAVRARDTALIACYHSQLSQARFALYDLFFSDDLLELSQGEWEGQSRSLIYTAEVLASMDADPWNFKAPGGESQREVEDRMYNWVDRTFLKRSDPEKSELSAAVFTHGVSIKCLLRKILGSSPSMTWKIKMDNTSMTRIMYDEKGWHVDYINNTEHLEK